MANTRPTTVLSPDERRNRIAELLCKAIHAGDAKAGISEPLAAASSKNQAVKAPAPTDEERVLNYLRHADQATPRVLRAALGLPRTTMYRILLRLSQQGLIGTSGNSRAVVHWLVNKENRPAVGPGAAASVRLERRQKGARISP